VTNRSRRYRRDVLDRGDKVTAAGPAVFHVLGGSRCRRVRAGPASFLRG
jgi:hypothetical protein